MSKLQIVKVDPLELPADITGRISWRYHIELKDFYVYVSEKDGKMYVNKSVPDEDVAEFIKIATCPGRYIDDNAEMGEAADHVHDKYGYATYKALYDYRQWTQRQQAQKIAKERMQEILPAIQKMVDVCKYDEDLIFETWSAGDETGRSTLYKRCGFNNIYVYYLGYLAGLGELKGDYSPKEVGNLVDVWSGVSEMLEHIDIGEMPRIYGYLKEMYFAE